MKQSNPFLFNIMKSVAWLVLLAAALNFSSCSSSEDEETYLGDWYEKSTFEGVARSGAVVFVIDNKTYVGTGYDGSKWLKDFWMYDASRDTWVRKADFPGTGRSGAVAFTANGKGYVGTGQNGVTYYKDFYSYDPTTDTWSSAQEVADFSGTARYGAIAFEINGRGYIGAGYDGNYLKDIWQYNPDNNQWTQKVSIGGNKRNNAFAFVINNKAYVGGGKNNGTLVQDFWEYDAEADAWTAKTDLDDEDLDYDSHSISRELASTFVINGYGYIVGGTTGGISAEVWQYDPTNDLWEQKTSFEGYARESAVGFAIGNMGYYATGRSSSLRFDDIWQFDPTAVDVDD